MPKQRKKVSGYKGLLNHYQNLQVAADVGDDEYRPNVLPVRSWEWRHILGLPGVPTENIIQLYGPGDCGKTSLARFLIAEVLRKDDRPAGFVDAEHKLDLGYTKRCGIDLKRLVIGRTTSKDTKMFAEEAWEMYIDMVDSGKFSIVVLDSIGGLIPKAMLEGNLSDAHMGLKARINTIGIEMLTVAKARSNTAVVLINQTRAAIGNSFKFENVPGGFALYFHSSAVIRVSRGDWIKSGGVDIGQDIILSTQSTGNTKNQLGTPRRKAIVPLIWGHGIWTQLEFIRTGARLGIVEKKGSHYSFSGVKLGQGEVNAAKSVTGLMMKSASGLIMTGLKEEEESQKIKVIE